MEDRSLGEEEQASAEMARALSLHLMRFLEPLLMELDTLLDRRLVATLLRLVQVIIAFRHSSHGLLLSELGAYLLSPAQAPAGTKRLSNLLRSAKWQHQVIDRYLWRGAEQRLQALEQGHEPVWLVWDESVLEKPESVALEGLCPVRSSQAARLKRIKPGFYNPPGGRPVFVPGMHWLGLLLVGHSGPPALAAMRWWSSRGVRATQRRSVEVPLLWECALQWGRRVVHVWDRGFAGGPWLKEALLHRVRFVLRWPKAYQLLDPQGQPRKAWECVRGKRSWGQHQLWDMHRHCYRKTGVVALEVRHPERPTSRCGWSSATPGRGASPGTW